MRSFLTSVAAFAVLAVGAYVVLETSVQQRADQAFSSHSGSVRIPTHGQTHNLVGTDWYSAAKH
jgi:hypothetical protein